MCIRDRATELYEFRGKGLIRFFSLLPLLVPGTVLTIGAQIMLLKVGLGDSIAAVSYTHLCVAKLIKSGMIILHKVTISTRFS